jgi:tetratricopeptide (TPR) repeat protein
MNSKDGLRRRTFQAQPLALLSSLIFLPAKNGLRHRETADGEASPQKANNPLSPSAAGTSSLAHVVLEERVQTRSAATTCSLVATALLLGAACSEPRASAPAGQAVTLFNRANAEVGKTLYDQAIADYGQAISADPTLAEAYIGRGVAYALKGEPDTAITDFNRAIALKPDLAQAWLNRGIAWRAKNDLDRAITDYNEAIRLDPSLPQTRNARAWALHLKGEDSKGLPDAELAVKFSPTEANYVETRAEILEALGQRDRALADYRTTLRLAPGTEAAIAGAKRLGAQSDR